MAILVGVSGYCFSRTVRPNLAMIVGVSATGKLEQATQDEAVPFNALLTKLHIPNLGSAFFKQPGRIDTP